MSIEEDAADNQVRRFGRFNHCPVPLLPVDVVPLVYPSPVVAPPALLEHSLTVFGRKGSSEFTRIGPRRKSDCVSHVLAVVGQYDLHVVPTIDKRTAQADERLDVPA
jgi:hypothetical protein